jgi:hypothetical protein
MPVAPNVQLGLGLKALEVGSLWTKLVTEHNAPVLVGWQAFGFPDPAASVGFAYHALYSQCGLEYELDWITSVECGKEHETKLKKLIREVWLSKRVFAFSVNQNYEKNKCCSFDETKNRIRICNSSVRFDTIRISVTGLIQNEHAHVPKHEYR